jgi:hypothetical protein
MRPRLAFTTVALATLMAMPAFAQDSRRQHDSGHQDRSQPAHAQAPRSEQRAAPRANPAPRQEVQRQAPRQEIQRQAPRQEIQRQQIAPRAEQRRFDAAPRAEVARPADGRRYDAARPNNGRVEAARPYDGRRYDVARPAPRVEVARPYSGGSRFAFSIGAGRYRPYGYGYSPRFIVAPRFYDYVSWRPYYYRPSLSIGIFYGDDGLYPYGYVPRGYFNPTPGRLYGGLRITGAPRDAQVFADGYYAGIVDDFDGVFQHLNLEVGPHHVEIDAPGMEPIAFDVQIEPGRTMTFRADLAGYRPY